MLWSQMQFPYEKIRGSRVSQFLKEGEAQEKVCNRYMQLISNVLEFTKRCVHPIPSNSEID